MSFDVVENLRNRLKNDYPALTKVVKIEGPRYSSVRMRHPFDTPVRPTFSSDEMNSMIQNSSRFVKMRDIEFGSSPKNNRPVMIKTQEWEVVTSLDCFLKHISTKSYQKYVTEKVPGFRKGIVKTVAFPEVSKKVIRKSQELCLNESNLELMGQKELSNELPKAEKRNLGKIKRKINREVKRWCINETKRADPEAQMIDYHTFKFKSF